MITSMMRLEQKENEIEVNILDNEESFVAFSKAKSVIQTTKEKYGENEQYNGRGNDVDNFNQSECYIK